MIQPYTAVGLIPTVRGIRTRADIKPTSNISRISSRLLPGSLASICLCDSSPSPKGRCKASTTKYLISIMCSLPENVPSISPAKRPKHWARLPDNTTPLSWPRPKRATRRFKDRYFNVGFILNPQGEVILQHYKVSPFFRSNIPSVRTISMIGGSNNMAATSMPSGPLSIPKLAVWAS